MNDGARGLPCPTCSEPLSNIGSQFQRHCTNGQCKAIWPWELKPGQKPLISSNRDKRKDPCAT